MEERFGMEEEMREYLAEKRLAAEVGLMLAAGRMKECAKRLVRDERGDTNFVSIIVIIVIVIAVAGVFHKQLSKAISDVFTNLTSFINGSEHGGLSNS